MKKLIIALLAFSMFVSCSKDKDKTCNLNAASVAGAYKVTAMRYKATAASPEIDYYNQWFTDVCERDDIITLNANGTYVFTDAGVKCTPPGDDTGTWDLSGNRIMINGDPSIVDSFNCSTLTISSSDIFNAGDKLIIVLTRQ